MANDATKKKKIRLLLILYHLQEHSDEDCHISTPDMVAMLRVKGIEVSDRIIHTDILLLIEYGFDIKYYRKKHYYYYIVDRVFDTPELKILIDAVHAASFISDEKTEALTAKIASLAGEHRAEVLKRNMACCDTHKHTNRYLYYNVDAIQTAIASGKKVSFVYYKYSTDKNRVYQKDGQRYIIDPVEFVCSNDRYYLIAYSMKHKGYTNYRVDRMEKVEVEQANTEYDRERAGFNANAYRKKAFSMFAGGEREVELTVADECIDAIIDKFGEDVYIMRGVGGTFRVKARIQISQMFFWWCIQAMGKIQITAPKQTVEEMERFKQSVKDSI